MWLYWSVSLLFTRFRGVTVSGFTQTVVVFVPAVFASKFRVKIRDLVITEAVKT